MLLRSLATTCALGALAGCGGAHHGQAPIAAARCRHVDAAELLAIGRRIYDQAATGRNVVSVRRRLARSARLSRAVAADDPRATVAALRPLRRHQIARIRVWGPDGRLLASIGTTAAPAPVAGVVDGPIGVPVGRYVLSVSSDAAIAGEIASVTGAPTRVTVAGTTAAAAGGPAGAVAMVGRFGGTAFPAGALDVSMGLSPALLAPCAPTAAATRMAVVRQVGARLLAAEQSGAQARRVLHHVQVDAGFRAAVAHRDPAALRTAIIRAFRTRSLHVVRIRASTPAHRLIGDVGGPFVLAPISGPVHDRAGRLIGHVTLSVQDDTGFIKLMHRFTGADVALHAGTVRVPGSLRLPPHAAARARLTAVAFPRGRLRIALALPA